MLNVYYDSRHAGSFGDVDSLHRANRKKVTNKQIRKWSEGVDSYTLHKPVRHEFVRNRVIVYNIDDRWQADLVDLVSIKKYNRGYRYILTCIDILSKYARVEPLERKTGGSIVLAFREIFLERKPKALLCDTDTGFKNIKFQKFLNEHNERFFITFNAIKASVVERFNRTLKTCM